MKNIRDVIVIGGGQSGLAAGYHLQKAGRSFVILEASEQVGGSWPHYYDSLHLFSPARYASLPGLPFPGEPEHYPLRDEVTAYLRQYAAHFQLPVRSDTRVETVTRRGKNFYIKTNQGDYTARSIIAATGGFHKPYTPHIPGREQFQGTWQHAFSYKEPQGFQGKRVIVVGGGNSAVQIAAELASVASVTLATRHPIQWMAQRRWGRDVHFWLRVTGLDYWPTKGGEHPPVLDDGRYRRALARGQFAHKPMFERFEAEGVVWQDGTVEAVDHVIFATGYRPNVEYLSELDLFTAAGKIDQWRGISNRVPGVYFVGLPFQRNLASATLRGSGPDAAYVMTYLTAYLDTASLPAVSPAWGHRYRHFVTWLRASYCRQFCQLSW